MNSKPLELLITKDLCVQSVISYDELQCWRKLNLVCRAGRIPDISRPSSPAPTAWRRGTSPTTASTISILQLRFSSRQKHKSQNFHISVIQTIYIMCKKATCDSCSKWHSRQRNPSSFPGGFSSRRLGNATHSIVASGNGMQ